MPAVSDAVADSEGFEAMAEPAQSGFGPAVAAALESLDDAVFRTGAPVDRNEFARVVDKRGLSAEESVLLLIEARAQGLVDEDGATDDSDDPTAVVAKSGVGASQSEFASLQSLFRAARRYPLLSASQETSLARRYEQGLAAGGALASTGPFTPEQRRELARREADGRLAKDTFICCNLRLVASIARGFQGQGLDLPDLVQEGILGMIRAVEKFDHRLGYKFSTYATWWIRQAISRALADKGRTIRLPVHIDELVRKIIATERRLCWELAREPTIRDIAERLNIDPGHVAFVREAAQAIVSLDGSVRRGEGDDDASLLDFISGTEPSVEQQVFAVDRRDRLDEALGHLSHREATVLRLRFGLGDKAPRTLDEVGRNFDVTRERIRQIQDEAIKKLRGILAQDDLTPMGREPAPGTTSPNGRLRHEGFGTAKVRVPSLSDAERLASLAGLTEDQRAVMIRRFGIGRESMPERAVAEQMGQDIGWVFARQNEAISRLRGAR
jgi:RNA polymerase primary sigma factor